MVSVSVYGDGGCGRDGAGVLVCVLVWVVGGVEVGAVLCGNVCSCVLGLCACCVWCSMSIWQSWMPVCCSVLFQSVCSVLFSFVREGKMGAMPLRV